MVEEQTYLHDARALAQEMLRHIDEALGTSDVDAARGHAEQAVDVAMNYEADLDAAMSSSEDPDLSDQLEEAMHHLDMAIDHGEAVIDASDEEVEEYLSAMLMHARQSLSYLQEAVGAEEE